MSEPIAHPPRFWWLKRLAAVGILLFASLLALRLWWGRIAQNRFDAEIAAAHSRGEPITFEDFQDPNPPPDDQNAAAQLKAAASSIFYNTAQQGFDNRFNPDVILSDADRKLLDGLVTANAKAIGLARAAVDLPRVDWHMPIASPIATIMLGHLNGQRQLANLFGYCAYNDHLHNRDANVIEDVHEIFAQSDLLQRDHPFLLTHLVSVGIDSLACSVIQRLADKLDISATASPASGAATPTQVRQLIAQILDERDYTNGGEQAWYTERLFPIDFVRNRAYTGTLIGLSPSGMRALSPLRPMLMLDALEMVQVDTAIAHAMRQATFPQALATIPPLRKSGSSPLHQATRILSGIMQPSFSRAIQTHYRGLTERRAAAILLAIRLYEFDSRPRPAESRCTGSKLFAGGAD